MRYRLRFRFRKEGDLRLISHRDLARLWERMFRRVGLQLAMSEGFHPKAKVSFPSALSLGVASWDEVMEVDLLAEVELEDVQQRLAAEAPAGLTITSIQPVPPGTPKAQVVRATYELPVPPERTAAVRTAIDGLLSSPEYWLARPGREAPVEIRGDIERLEVAEGRLTMTLAVRPEATARPRDLLPLLGLGDLEALGVFLTRTHVELA